MIRHRDSSPAPVARAVATRLALSFALLLTLLGRPAHAEEVLVWPRIPSVATDGVDAALRSAGHRPRDFAGLRAQLIAEQQRDQTATAAALAAIETDLADARAAYLAQRYPDMIAALARAEALAVATLDTGPACTATLWELEFQLGLAYTARNQPGDQDLARARFALALALDPARRPVAGLYGPDLGLAFIKVVDEVALRPPRPLRLDLTPNDATVVIDCHPLASDTSLRPGLHLVRVTAPGHALDARLLDLPAAELRTSLRPDPAAPLGPWWTRGALDPDRPSARLAVQARVGPITVVWLDTLAPQHLARAMIAGQLRRIARADTPADAAVQVLATAPPKPPPAPAPRRRRTALWLGLAGAAVGSLALGLGLGLGLRDTDDPHLKLVAP